MKFSSFTRFRTSINNEIFFLQEVLDLVKELFDSLHGVLYFLSKVFYLIYTGCSPNNGLMLSIF